MNTANLQLEGLYLAVASLNQMLVEKGVVGREDIDHALHRAEAVASSDERSEELSPANRDAIAFSIRLLRLANRETGDAASYSFSELARRVGETKRRYNDQR